MGVSFSFGRRIETYAAPISPRFSKWLREATRKEKAEFFDSLAAGRNATLTIDGQQYRAAAR